MASPQEPLLQFEPERPPRSKALTLTGGAAILALAAAGVLLFIPGRAPIPEETPPAPGQDAPVSKAPRTEPGRPRTEAPPADGAEERQARELFDAADAFERGEPGEYEKRMSRWREVVTKFPTSSWARKADERHRAAAASLQTFLDREFESTRKDAQALSAAGHFADAVEAIQAYKSAQSRDVLKRRADAEIAGIENASRLAFNEASAKARELAAKDDTTAAAAIFDALARGAIPDVAARCKTAMAQLQASAAARARHLQARKGDDVRQALREDLAPKVLALVRARQYDEAMKELSSAAGSAANAAAKDEITAERAAVADASSFWEAFLKAARARTGQEASILLADGKRLSGKISRVQADRITLEGGDGAAEAALDKLHADLLVGWTIGRTLPAEEAVTYVKAALFFFCEGRDDLAKLYLATARELNGPADAAEKVFREGFLRAATAVRK